VLITVKEAADLLGLKSRGSIYRKIKNRELPHVDSPDGPMIERDRLEQVWNSITRKRSDSPRPMAERTATRPARPSEAPEPTRDDLPNYNESRARSEFEKANLLELERKTKEGQLLRREDAQQAWAAAVNITRTKLLGIPSVAKQRIPHLTLEEIEVLMGLQREALDELAAGEVKA
jgi:excisionase family DNA binding protein